MALCVQQNRRAGSSPCLSQKRCQCYGGRASVAHKLPGCSRAAGSGGWVQTGGCSATPRPVPRPPARTCLRVLLSRVARSSSDRFTSDPGDGGSPRSSKRLQCSRPHPSSPRLSSEVPRLLSCPLHDPISQLASPGDGSHRDRNHCACFQAAQGHVLWELPSLPRRYRPPPEAGADGRGSVTAMPVPGPSSSTGVGSGPEPKSGEDVVLGGQVELTQE